MRLTSELVCQTCQKHPATFLASLNGEAWVACIRCREQGQRKGSDASFAPLGGVEAFATRSISGEVPA